LLAHGKTVDDSELPVGVRWGVGGAIAQKFAQEGFFTVLTTRKEANAAKLAVAIREQGGDCMIVELDLVSQDSIANAFAKIRGEAGDPEVLIYNAGYMEGRDLPPDKELLEHMPTQLKVTLWWQFDLPRTDQEVRFIKDAQGNDHPYIQAGAQRHGIP
jgi:NAD(P)-dependent dehydrogenase (short-subunit alcohol dehydrogenase family)